MFIPPLPPYNGSCTWKHQSPPPSLPLASAPLPFERSHSTRGRRRPPASIFNPPPFPRPALPSRRHLPLYIPCPNPPFPHCGSCTSIWTRSLYSRAAMSTTRSSPPCSTSVAAATRAEAEAAATEGAVRVLAGGTARLKPPSVFPHPTPPTPPRHLLTPPMASYRIILPHPIRTPVPAPSQHPPCRQPAHARPPSLCHPGTRTPVPHPSPRSVPPHPPILFIPATSAPSPVSGPSPALVPPHPPTLVTTQTLHGGSGAAAQNADAHLVWPRNNRLMIFRGDRLHGVLPGPKAPGAHPATPLGEPYPKRRAAELSSFEGGALGKGKPGPDTREIDEVGEIDEISEIGEIDEDRVTLMFGWWGEGHTPPLPSKRLTTQPKAAAGPPLAPCMRLPRPAPPSPPATSRRAALPSAAAGARHAAPPTSAAGARRADARGEEEDYMRNRWRQVPNWVAEGAAIPVILGAGGSDLPRAGATSDLGVCCCLHRPDEAVGRSNRRKRAGPADIQEQQNPASMGSAGDVTVGKPSQGAVTSVGRVWVNVPAMPDPNPPTPRLVSLLGQGSVSFRSLFFLESFDQIEALGRRPQSAAAADAAPHDARASASASVCAGVAGPGAEPRKGVARHGGGGGADDDCEVVDLASARAQMDRQRDGLRGAPKDRLAKGAGGSAASGEAEEEEVFDLAAARALAEQQRDGARHLSDRPLALAALPLRCAMPWRVQGAL